MYKRALDWYTGQDDAKRMVDYLHSLAANFYYQNDQKSEKWREMKSYVAKRLAKQNWNEVAVDLIEKVKVLSLKMEDYQNFFQSEFELINVK